jgi:polysaccharide export outer membrane protein
VNTLGNIEIPLLGNIKAAGLTIAQLQTILTDKLVTYVKDPVVKIKFSLFVINVLGEVKAPGTKTFPADYVTIMDAIGAGADLTDFAKREDILVIREENGRRRYFKMDLKSGAIFQSPAYQLQPNDVVYVPANNIKLVTVNESPTAGRNLNTVLSVTSIFVSIATSLLYTLTR